MRGASSVRRTVLAVIAVVLAVSTSACGAASPGGSTTSATKQHPAQCDDQDSAQCYRYSLVLTTFCKVQQVRKLLRQGSVQVSDLPRWTDAAPRGGEPVIIDLRRPRDYSLSKREDELSSAVQAVGARIDLDAVSDCRRRATIASMRATIGGVPAA